MKRIVCCLVLLLLLVGCGPKKGDIIDPTRCDTVQGILHYDELGEQKGFTKKIFCNFSCSGEMVVEDINSSTKETTETRIKDKELEDVKTIFLDALKDQCPDSLVASEEEADLVIKANIIRLVGRVTQYEVSGDESMIFTGGDNQSLLEYQAGLTVETDINGKKSSYDHIILLSIDKKIHVEKMYAVVAASTTRRATAEFVTKYDSIPLATGAIINHNKQSSYLGLNTFDFDRSGYVDIYDLSTMEVERHLDLANANIIWWWDDKDDDREVWGEVLGLYGSGVGAMRYLVYDYVKNLLAEVQNAQ